MRQREYIIFVCFLLKNTLVNAIVEKILLIDMGFNNQQMLKGYMIFNIIFKNSS